MTATTQQLKSPKNKPATIINNTKPNFISPLDLYIENNCKHCQHYQGLCRPNDSRGLTPMTLCIMLYTGQPPDLKELLKVNLETGKISEKTLQEAEIE